MAEKDLHHRITGDSSSLERASDRGARSLTRMERESRRLERQQQRTHQTMERLGRGMLVAGAAIAAGLTLAVRAAIDWETAWAGVLKTVDGTEEQMAALEEDIRALTAVLPASHQEIAAVAEAAGQLGVRREDVAQFTATMINLGVATNLSAQEAATALARLMNIMQTAPDDVDRLGAAVVDLGNNAATTEAEIVEMALRIAGAGATIGLTEADVLAFSSALSSVGINAAAGGTAISRVFLEIDKSVRAGGTSLEAFATTAGMTADEFAVAYEQDAAGAIATFVEGLGRVQRSGGDVNAVLGELGLTEIRVSDALRRLSGAGDLLTDSLGRSSDAWEDNTALLEEAERRYGTTEAQMQIARNQMNDLAIDIGSALLPAVGELAAKVGGLAEFIGDLPAPLKATAAVLAAVTAALLLAGGTALVAVPRIAAFKASLDQLAASGGRAAAAVGVLRGATSTMVGLLAGPWGIALAAATVALGIWANENAKAEARTREVIDTLDEQTGAITQNTRVWVANQLEQQGVADLAEKVGISMNDLVDAALGNEAAIRRVNAAMKDYSDGLDVAAISQEEGNKQVVLSVDELSKLGDEIDTAQEQQRRMNEVMDQATDAASNLDPETRNLADSLNLSATGAENAAEALDQMEDEVSALFDAVFGLSRAEDELTETFRRAEEQFNSNTDGLEGNSEAAIKNRRTAEELLEAYAALVLETLKHTSSQEEAEKAVADFERELDALEEQTGVNIRELEGYNDVASEIDRQIEVQFSVPGGRSAVKTAQEIRDEFNRIPRDIFVSVHTSGGTLPSGGMSVARQHGGIIPGSGPPDSVSLRATPGEFVVTPAATRRNLAALNAANAGARLTITEGDATRAGPTARIPVLTAATNHHILEYHVDPTSQARKFAEDLRLALRTVPEVRVDIRSA